VERSLLDPSFLQLIRRLKFALAIIHGRPAVERVSDHLPYHSTQSAIDMSVYGWSGPREQSRRIQDEVSWPAVVSDVVPPARPRGAPIIRLLADCRPNGSSLSKELDSSSADCGLQGSVSSDSGTQSSDPRTRIRPYLNYILIHPLRGSVASRDGDLADLLWMPF